MSSDRFGVDHQDETEPPEGLYQFDRTVNKRVPTLDDITEADLGFYQEHGYLVVDEFLDEAEIEAAKAGMESLLSGAVAKDSDVPDRVVQFEDGAPEDVDGSADVPPEELLYSVRKYRDFADHSERMVAPAERADLLDVISTIVDGEPERFLGMGMIKPPGGREKPWHQDKSYFEVRLDAPVVGAWIALDAAFAENGCMHVIPGSHTEGPVVHFDRRDWQICDTDVQVDRDVMAPLKPGGLLLFDGLIHHGTPPNTSHRLRRALQFHYTAAHVEWLEERPSAFGSTDKDVEC